MFVLFILILLIIAFPSFRFLFLVLLLMFVAYLLYCHFHKQQEVEPTEINHYKIGTEVSKYFYDEVKQYCNKHHITISDLIRNAVRAYMDSNR